MFGSFFDRSSGEEAGAASTAAQLAQHVADGTRLVAREKTAIFVAVDSWQELAPVEAGEAVVAAGPAQYTDGYVMASVRPTGAVDLSSFEVPGTAGFTTRPSASLGEDGEGSTLSRETASEMQSVRAIRMQAYKQKHGGLFRRRSSRCACAWAVLTAPLVIAWSILRRLLDSLCAVANAVLGVLSEPTFWIGVCSALAFVWWLAWQHCAERAAAPNPRWPEHQPVQLICESRHPWAHELRGAAWSLMALMADGRARAAEGWVTLSSATEAVVRFCSEPLWPLFGWCPYRSAEDALTRCGQRAELQAIREARDCGLLRRAFHEGQRQFHPDHLRLKHPACSDKILEACSVALNAAMEDRRGALGCPTR